MDGGLVLPENGDSAYLYFDLSGKFINQGIP
jgi:hypothetical protein